MALPMLRANQGVCVCVGGGSLDTLALRDTLIIHTKRHRIFPTKSFGQVLLHINERNEPNAELKPTVPH